MTEDILKQAAAHLLKARQHDELKKLETAAAIEQETVESATLYRLYRLVDKDFNRILSEHIDSIVDTRSADTAIDMYDMNYLLNLPLSYLAISELCTNLSALVSKYGISTPAAWRDAINGMYPYEIETEQIR
jgi:hypothetical protein